MKTVAWLIATDSERSVIRFAMNVTGIMLKNAIYRMPRSFVRCLRSVKQSMELDAMDRAMAAFGATGYSGEPAGKTSYSQHNEDHILSSIFSGRSDGTALEVGGFDGVTFSNTYLFERKGWRTIIVEPMPEFARKIRLSRHATLFECAAGSHRGMSVFTIARGVEALSTLNPTGHQLANMQHHGAVLEEIQVSVRTLDDMLESAAVEKLDFVTIDVEGHETEAIAGLTLSRWKPDIVLVEDGSMGADLSVRSIMREKGYRRFMTTACNDWYAPESDKRVISTGAVWRDRFRVGLSRSLGVLEKVGARLSASQDTP